MRKRKIIKSLPRPTENLVLEYEKKFNKNEEYYLGDQAIRALIKQFPGNTEIKDIYIKVVAINTIYNAGIRATSKLFEMAKHISELNIDNELERGNPEIVCQIAELPNVRNFYAFATKYCSFHRPEEYPIYDSFVSEMLIRYQDEHLFDSNGFAYNDLQNFRNYPKFKEILSNFKQHYNLNSVNFKQIDKFLWMLHKELFPV